jgi:hypothetical protein
MQNNFIEFEFNAEVTCTENATDYVILCVYDVIALSQGEILTSIFKFHIKRFLPVENRLCTLTLK